MSHSKAVDIFTDFTAGAGLCLTLKSVGVLDIIHILAGIGGLVVIYLSIRIKLLIFRAKKREEQNLRQNGGVQHGQSRPGSKPDNNDPGDNIV